MLFAAIIPFFLIIILLCILKQPALKTYVIVLVATAILTLFPFTLSPLDAISAIWEGVITAFLPVCVLIFSSLYMFNLIKSDNDRVSCSFLEDVAMEEDYFILLVILGLGSILEGLIGFGISLIIPLTILINLGYDPYRSTRAALVAMSIPTSFGSFGLPQQNLAFAADLDIVELCRYTLLLEAVPLMLLPVLAIYAYHGSSIDKKNIVKLVFLGMAYSSSFIVGGILLNESIAVLISGISILLAIILTNRNSFANIRKIEKSTIKYFLPAICSLLLLCIPIITRLAGYEISLTTIDMIVYTGEFPATIRLDFFNSPGVWILIGTILGATIEGINRKTQLQIAYRTLSENWRIILCMCLVFSISRLMSYSDMATLIAMQLADSTGKLYTLFCTMIGALGSFLTGSNSSANILFGPIQASVGMKLSMSPYLFAAFNAVGAGIGKMISPQNMMLSSTLINDIDYSKIRSTVVVFIMLLLLCTLECYLLCF